MESGVKRQENCLLDGTAGRMSGAKLLLVMAAQSIALFGFSCAFYGSVYTRVTPETRLMELTRTLEKPLRIRLKYEPSPEQRSVGIFGDFNLGYWIRKSSHTFVENPLANIELRYRRYEQEGNTPFKNGCLWALTLGIFPLTGENHTWFEFTFRERKSGQVLKSYAYYIKKTHSRSTFGLFIGVPLALLVDEVAIERERFESTRYGSRIPWEIAFKRLENDFRKDLADKDFHARVYAGDTLSEQKIYLVEENLSENPQMANKISKQVYLELKEKGYHVIRKKNESFQPKTFSSLPADLLSMGRRVKTDILLFIRYVSDPESEDGFKEGKLKKVILEILCLDIARQKILFADSLKPSEYEYKWDGNPTARDILDLLWSADAI